MDSEQQDNEKTFETTEEAFVVQGPYLEVKTYRVTYELKTNRCQLEIWVGTASQRIVIPISSEAAFSGIFSMLGKHGLMFHTDGYFHLPQKHVGT